MTRVEIGAALSRLWRSFAPAEAGTPVKPEADMLHTWKRDLDACAREQGGAIAARARATELIDAYRGMRTATRIEALTAFAVQLKPDAEAIRSAFASYQEALGTDAEWRGETALRATLESPRARVIRLIGSVFGGVRFLAALRAELFGLLKAHPHLQALEAELEVQLSEWFDVGFLELRRIGWESPAHILEKLMQYEAVHEISSWADMKNRLDGDRRVYAFFHPRLRDEPLVFVEVALTGEIAGNVQVLLDQAAPVFDTRRARAAMFYSISSTQTGLRGISFGNFLLKRVVEDLKRDFPKLEHFVTLSPIPGFAKWLDKQALPSALKAALATDWRADEKLSNEMRAPMMSLAAHYLKNAKNKVAGGGPTVAPAGTRPADAVARFHLGNGARLERLHWLADISEKGLKQSHGLMVNFYYDLDHIQANLEAFDAEGAVAANGRIERLATLGRRMLEQSQRAAA